MNSQIDELHKQATRAAHSAASGAASATTGASSSSAGGALRPPTRPMEGVPGFFTALGRVVRRDLGLDKK